MSAFIHGMGLISTQETFGKNSLGKVIDHQGTKLESIEPDYTNWIDPKVIRRMSKIIRTGVASAKLALHNAGLEKPDAIITGTGLGCLDDTEVFLNKLIDNKEEALNPTPFIQSTHNTIGSQVALITQCLGYNQTYTHRAFSFELALEDALMLLKENPKQNILAGGVDELTTLSLKALTSLGLNKAQGEGAGFFMLNGEKQDAVAELSDVTMIFKPKQATDVQHKMDELLNHAGLTINEIDLVLSGETGNAQDDVLLKEVLDSTNLASKAMIFKNLCGEYSTASAFAVWHGATILKSGELPKGLTEYQRPVRNVLIYNQYLNQHHTLILLKAC